MIITAKHRLESLMFLPLLHADGSDSGRRRVVVAKNGSFEQSPMIE
ncbi:hypothetical protein [Raoultella ornithinolytica]|jgi:hypothetical protein|nr:hypothetical protein [Raoultella ornithinolytica]VTM87801.1 Uncharacterised protein [Raoultella ornithinolytica]